MRPAPTSLGAHGRPRLAASLSAASGDAQLSQPADGRGVGEGARNRFKNIFDRIVDVYIIERHSGELADIL